MPEVLPRYIPPTDNASKDNDALGATERQQRKAAIDKAWKYYDGEMPSQLKVFAGEGDDNVKLNLVQQTTDKVVSFMAPKAPVIMLPDETEQQGDESAAQTALDAFWEANEEMEYLSDQITTGVLAGHCFAKLVPPDVPGEPPQLKLLDPRHVTAYWDITETDRVLWYTMQWEQKGNSWSEARRQDIVPAWLLAEEPVYERDSTWVIIEYRQNKLTSNRWEEVARDEWPYPFSPICEWKALPRPHQYYGRPMLRNLRLNDSINFIASNTAKIIKFHAHPHEVIIGATLKTKEDEGTTAETSVGGVTELPAGTDAKLLEAHGDIANSINYYAMLRSAWFTEHRVVDWASQSEKVGQLTNFGLRVLFNDMMDMIEQMRRLYGKGLSEISRRALIMMGIAVTDLPTVTWANPLPVDRKEELEAATMEKALGVVSDRSLAEGLERDYDKEMERKEEEQQGAASALTNALVAAGQVGFGPPTAPPGNAGFQPGAPGRQGAILR